MEAISKQPVYYNHSKSSTIKGAYLYETRNQIQEATQDSRSKFVENEVSQVKPKNSDEERISRDIQNFEKQQASIQNHERAHMQSGGEFSGSPSYLYTRGPDGKIYIIGGEVKLHIPATDDLDKLEKALQKVKRAALAPMNPSPQDLKTAALASTKEASVRYEIAKIKAKEAYEKAKKLTGSDNTQLEVHVFKDFKFNEFRNFTLFV